MWTETSSFAEVDLAASITTSAIISDPVEVELNSGVLSVASASGQNLCKQLFLIFDRLLNALKGDNKYFP